MTSTSHDGPSGRGAVGDVIAAIDRTTAGIVERTGELLSAGSCPPVASMALSSTAGARRGPVRLLAAGVALLVLLAVLVVGLRLTSSHGVVAAPGPMPTRLTNPPGPLAGLQL